jgi:ribokinase
MKTIISSQMLSKQPVCLIGNLNIDLIIRNVPHLPIWGQEVLGSSHVQVSSGQGGYTAFALRGLQAPTCLIGNVGDDIYGQQIKTDLQKKGVDVDGVTVEKDGQTGITVAIVREDGERAFVSNLGCLRSFNGDYITPFQNKIDQAGIVGLVGIFNLPGFTLLDEAKIFHDFRSAGKITMLDSGWDPANWPASTLQNFRALLHEINIFLPNWDETQAITGKNNLEDAAHSLLSEGPDIVVIKGGKEGSHVFTKEESFSLPALPVTVYDAVGAGDTFNAGFLAGFRQGWPLDACLALGNAAAALYISKPTDRFPSLDDAITAANPYGLIPIHSNIKKEAL